LLLAALACHACARYPRFPADIRLLRGCSISALGSRGGTLSMGPGTRYSTWWIHLVLVGEGGPTRVLLLKDQLETHDWRALQAAVRRRPECADGPVRP